MPAALRYLVTGIAECVHLVAMIIGYLMLFGCAASIVISAFQSVCSK